jgi:hypothetical protein
MIGGQGATTPEELLEMIEAPGFELYDQWEAQTQAMIQRKAAVYLYSSLDHETVRNATLTPTDSVEATLAARSIASAPTRASRCCPKARRRCHTCWTRSHDRQDGLAKYSGQPFTKQAKRPEGTKRPQDSCLRRDSDDSRHFTALG